MGIENAKESDWRMISLQRFILAFLAINLIVGFTSEIYNNPSLMSETEINNTIKQLEEKESTMRNTDEGLASGFWNMVAQVGDLVMLPVKVIVAILKFFANGLLPFNLSPTDYVGIERIIVYGIAWFRSMFWVLIAIEAYMFRMNKKVS